MELNNNLSKVAVAAILKVAHETSSSDTKSHNEAIPIVDPNSNRNTENQRSIQVAKYFLQDACPTFLDSNISQDDDRLVKIGRSIVDLVNAKNSVPDEEHDEQQHDHLESALELIVQGCNILSSSCDNTMKVPKVRFGKTNLQMPTITLGCMRFQQSWVESNVPSISHVSSSCQDNLKQILRHAILNLGINHIETARGYGSSEVQIGEVLKSLFQSGEVQRKDLIIQTKVNPMMSPKAFRETLESSFQKLQLDYIDLFSFHGVNLQRHYDIIFHNKENNGQSENLMDIIREYQAKGMIRHVGFSSHGQADIITKLIETNEFEYANIHYHAFGSYTASGAGKYGGNLQNVRLMKAKDMGVFIISPYDKGGRLYAPSKKLRSLTLPDLEPIQYGSLWLLSHEDHDEEHAPIHTIVCGAARPSDLDEPAVAAYLYGSDKVNTLKRVQNISKRLDDAQVSALGEEWVNTWFQGLPNCNTEDDCYPIGQIVWLYNVIQAFGLLDFAKDRYGTFDGNLSKWDFKLSTKENIEKIGVVGWGYMPGISTNPNQDLSELLLDVPPQNKERLKKAIEFVWKYCSKSSDHPKVDVPTECQTAYDMRPWTAFPERS